MSCPAMESPRNSRNRRSSRIRKTATIPHSNSSVQIIAAGTPTTVPDPIADCCTVIIGHSGRLYRSRLCIAGMIIP